MTRITDLLPRLDSSEIVLFLWCLALGLAGAVIALPLIADAADRNAPAQGGALVLELAILAPFWLALFVQEHTGLDYHVVLFVIGGAAGLIAGLLLVGLLRLPERGRKRKGYSSRGSTGRG